MIKGPQSRCFYIDERMRIRFAQGHPRTLQNICWRIKWIEKIFRRHICQFRNIMTGIFTISIKFLPLRYWIKNTKVRSSVGPASGNPLPASCVRGSICIKQAIQNQASPCLQSRSRFFTRNEPTIIRTRLCI